MASQKKKHNLSGDQRQLLSYWRSKRDGNGLPKRSQIHPKDMIFCLAHLSIIERTDEGYVFRLTGSSIRDILGSEFRGRPVSDIRHPMVAWAAALDRSLGEGLPMYGMKQLTGARGHTWMRLPMVDHVGEPKLLLCYDKIVRFDRVGETDEQAEEGEGIDPTSPRMQLQAIPGIAELRTRFAA